MAKLKDDPVGQPELIRYLEEASDFAFELAVLNMLSLRSLPCEHGGHYEDPKTKKSREFDIRCRVVREMLHLHIAIECKNIRSNFPILVSGVPRRAFEAYHEIVMSRPVQRKQTPRGPFDIPLVPTQLLPQPRVSVIRQSLLKSFYPEGVVAGKSTAQVGITNQDAVHAHDSELYEKWGQCVASLSDLVAEFPEVVAPDREHPKRAGMALPIIVVPDGRLWLAQFTSDGSRLNAPTTVDRCSIYAGMDYEIGPYEDRLRVSHVEIMTLRGLAAFVDTHLADFKTMKRLFGFLEGA